LGGRTAAIDDGRQLEAQALAETRGCLDVDIISVEGGEYDLALVWPGELGQSLQRWSLSKKENTGRTRG